ncbi:hypothetical protein [Variovorax sp. V118]|uniref:hypothetical protein n=1 Tax=Variovorax sp. V118 TaxID=3065954 RepID=UPI0034E8465E
MTYEDDTPVECIDCGWSGEHALCGGCADVLAEDDERGCPICGGRVVLDARELEDRS